MPKTRSLPSAIDLALLQGSLLSCQRALRSAASKHSSAAKALDNATSNLRAAESALADAAKSLLGKASL